MQPIVWEKFLQPKLAIDRHRGSCYNSLHPAVALHFLLGPTEEIARNLHFANKTKSKNKQQSGNKGANGIRHGFGCHTFSRSVSS